MTFHPAFPLFSLSNLTALFPLSPHRITMVYLPLELVRGALEIPQTIPAIDIALGCLQVLKGKRLLLKTSYTLSSEGRESTRK